MFQLVQSGSDPNTGGAIVDLRGLNAEPLRCLIRALEREAKDGDRYVAEDLLKAIREPEAWAKIKAQYDPAGPHLSVYFDPEWKERDGKGFCVDVDYPEGPGSEGRRFASAQAAGGFVAGRLVEMTKRI